MSHIAKSIAHSVGVAVHNVVQTIAVPVQKLVTQPSKLNLGDALVLGTAGLAAPTVNAVRHPGDIPTEAAIIVGGAALAGALTAPALTVAAAPTVATPATPLLTTSAYESASTGGAGILDLGYVTPSYAAAPAVAGGVGGGAGYGLVAGPLDLNYVPPVYAAAPGTPASMGSTSLFSSLARSGGGFFSSILNGIAEVGKAIAAPLATTWLYDSLNKGNSQPPSGAGDITVSNLPPGATDPQGFSDNATSIPGSVLGGGTGYGPYGATAPTDGTPTSTDATPTLFNSTGGASRTTFYILLVGSAVIAYWFLFRKKKFSLA